MAGAAVRPRLCCVLNARLVIVVVSIAVWASLARAQVHEARRWTPATIASDQYESSPTFTPDGREMLFMRSDTSFRSYRILWSRCEHGAWTAPRSAPFSAEPPALDADPFVTADGAYVYFVSSRHDPGGDDLDIWRAARRGDGRWGRPQHLPEPVNSPASELLPRVDGQGQLYFGSSRPGGYGKSDIYVATPAPDGGWRVVNVGPPVSSAADEYEADISLDGRNLIVVADRGDRSHLYRFELKRGAWIERGRVPAYLQVFQVGPLQSPHGDRLLFAQADGERSGEIFLVDLAPEAVADWPPRCE